MDENIFLGIILGDEPISIFHIEPFDSSPNFCGNDFFTFTSEFVSMAVLLDVLVLVRLLVVALLLLSRAGSSGAAAVHASRAGCAGLSGGRAASPAPRSGGTGEGAARLACGRCGSHFSRCCRRGLRRGGRLFSVAAAVWHGCACGGGGTRRSYSVSRCHRNRAKGVRSFGCSFPQFRRAPQAVRLQRVCLVQL